MKEVNPLKIDNRKRPSTNKNDSNHVENFVRISNSNKAYVISYSPSALVPCNFPFEGKNASLKVPKKDSSLGSFDPPAF